MRSCHSLSLSVNSRPTYISQHGVIIIRFKEESHCRNNNPDQQAKKIKAKDCEVIIMIAIMKNCEDFNI